MMVFARQSLICFTAFAVLVVATTCTSSGCLLPQLLSSAQAAPQKSCCQTRAKHAPAQNQPEKSCPACNDNHLANVNAVKTIDQLKVDQASVLFPAFFSAATFTLALGHTSLGNAFNLPP